MLGDARRTQQVAPARRCASGIDELFSGQVVACRNEKRASLEAGEPVGHSLDEVASLTAVCPHEVACKRLGAGYEIKVTAQELGPRRSAESVAHVIVPQV